MTREEMNKMERLAEIMFQEDEERYNNNQDLMYHTKEDFEAEKAEREYFNKFSTDGGRQNPVKKAEVMKSSVTRKPIMGNEDGQNHRFVLAYDPARSYDNSIVTIVDLVETEDRGLIAKIITHPIAT